MSLINKSKSARKLWALFAMTVGALIYAVGVSVFLDPLGIAPGGVTGISVILTTEFPALNTGIIVLAINIPLLIAGTIRFGKEFLFSTVWATFSSSMFMAIIERLVEQYNWEPFSVEDPLRFLFSSIIGGSMMGIGMGFIFRHDGTTGGSDIVVKFLRQKIRHINSGMLFILLDMTVAAASAIVMQSFEKGLYAGITIVTCSLVFNAVLYGGDTAHLVYIVSEIPETIAKRLMSELDVGISYIRGEGGFTESEKRIILCAAKNRTFPRVKQIVREEDPRAFMIVTSAKEIYGEGFKENKNIEI